MASVMDAERSAVKTTDSKKQESKNVPDKIKDTLKSIVKENLSSDTIVISDTELEEGEIETEELENDDNQDQSETFDGHCESNSVPAQEELRPSSKTEIEIDNKAVSRYPGNNSLGGTSREVFSWSDLRFLMVGDERLIGFSWKEWSDFPDQEIHYLQNANLRSICMLVDKNLRKTHDVVVIFAFHHEFVLTETVGKSSNKNRLMDLSPHVKFSDIFNIVEEYHCKWQRLFPNTNIIWTIPYPPDFLKYNHAVLKEREVDHKIKLDERKQQELSKDYFELSRLLTQEWMTNMEKIPVFPLNKLLFVKKHCYKKSFVQDGPPKFPRGFLKDGFYPTKMMASYCAYLLIELLLDEGLYPEHQVGLNWAKAEERLLEVDPEAKNFIHSSDRSHHSRKRSRHCRQQSHRHRRRSSLSPRSSHSRSWSRSRSRRSYRSRSTSRHLRRTRSRSRSRHRYRSRSRSRSMRRRHSHRSKFRKSHSSSLSLPSSESDSNKTENNTETKLVNLPSLPGPAVLNPSVSSIKGKAATKGESKDTANDEVNFWRTLRYLREVHDMQCTMYRRKPNTHPSYEAEKSKFLKRLENSSLGSAESVNWNEFWPKRLEGIFKENWESKKKQLMIDLNMQTSSTLLQIARHNKMSTNDSKEIDLTEEFSADKNEINEENERMKFKSENLETITSYLNEFENTVESSDSSPSVKPALSKEKDDNNDSLADIFKDSPKHHGKNDFEDKLLKAKNTSKRVGHFPKKSNSILTFEDSPIDLPPVKVCTPRMESTIDICSPPRESKNDSSGSSSSSDESDMDLDQLMDNPDFLQGLEEIDRELQNAGHKEESVPKNTSSKSLSINNLNIDLKSVFEDNNRSGKFNLPLDDINSEFVNVLKMLFRLAKRLGPLGLSISALYHTASEDFKNHKDTISSLSADAKTLLILVNSKLNSLLKENLTQVQNAIFGEVSERLKALLFKLNVKYDKFSGVNVQSIATATMGQDVAQVVSFIKNTLLYHGYTDFTSDDVMNIYMSVKAAQLDLQKRS